MTGIDSDLVELRERKRLLDDVWLLTFFAIFIAVGVPWFLHVLEINLAPIAWSLFGYSLVYFAGTLAADRLRSRRGLLMAVVAAQGAGVLLIGFLWHLTGSTQNPVFLLVFVVPVVAGSLVLLGWQSYATALLSIVTVITVALVDTPELRWYVIQSGWPFRWLLHLIPLRVEGLPHPFPSLDPSPSYILTLLMIFAVLLLAIGLMTEAMTLFMRRLCERLAASKSDLARAEGLFTDVVRASSSPIAIVYADTFRVAHASQSFIENLSLTPESLRNNNLFGLVAFSYPEVIEGLIVGKGGEVPLAIYRAGGQPRLAKVRVSPITCGGTKYAYVSLEDISNLYCLEAAFNAIDDGLIVIGADGRVQYFNQSAKNLLGEVELGMDPEVPLRQASLPDRWWELGTRSRQERRVEFGGKRYKASCFAARILGERDALTVMSLEPMGAGG